MCYQAVYVVIVLLSVLLLARIMCPWFSGSSEEAQYLQEPFVGMHWPKEGTCRFGNKSNEEQQKRDEKKTS